MKKWNIKDLLKHFEKPNKYTKLNPYSAAHCADYYINSMKEAYQNMIDSGHDFEREYYHYVNLSREIKKFL